MERVTVKRKEGVSNLAAHSNSTDSVSGELQQASVYKLYHHHVHFTIPYGVPTPYIILFFLLQLRKRTLLYHPLSSPSSDGGLTFNWCSVRSALAIPPHITQHSFDPWIHALTTSPPIKLIDTYVNLNSLYLPISHILHSLQLCFCLSPHELRISFRSFTRPSFGCPRSILTTASFVDYRI